MADVKTDIDAQEVADKALELVFKQINKSSKNEKVIKIGHLGAMKALDVPVTSTGSIALDVATGVGGLPRGRIIELFGPEAAGKTTLCLSAVAEVQRQNLKAAYIDMEHTISPAYAKTLGVDLDKLIFCQPNTGDEAMRIVDQLINSNLVDFIVVDSVASLFTDAEAEGDVTDNHIGQLARLMSKSLKKFTTTISNTNTTLLFVNQIRMKIGVMFASPETTPGGNALKFYSTMRLDFRRTKPIKQGEDTIGAITRVKVVKNKVAPPFKQAFFNIIYGKGIDKETDLVTVATELDIIQKSGSWYSYNKNKLGQGLVNTIDTLNSTPKLMKEIKSKVMETLDIISDEE